MMRHIMLELSLVSTRFVRTHYTMPEGPEVNLFVSFRSDAVRRINIVLWEYPVGFGEETAPILYRFFKKHSTIICKMAVYTANQSLLQAEEDGCKELWADRYFC